MTIHVNDMDEFVGQFIDVIQDCIDDCQWWKHLTTNDRTICGSAYDVLARNLMSVIKNWSEEENKNEDR